MDAYFAALKNHRDSQKILDLILAILERIKNHQNQHLLKEFGFYPILIECLKVDTPRPTARKILLLMCEDFCNHNSAVVAYFRPTNLLESWSKVLTSIPRGDEFKKHLFDKMLQLLVEFEIIEMKATPENLLWLSKFAKAVNEEHLKKGEFDVYGHYHLQKVHHYFWAELLVKFKSVHDKLVTFKGNVKYEILEIIGLNLTPKDSNGLSDPFISIKDGAGKRLWKSDIKKKNLNPHWDFKHSPIEITTKLDDVEHHLELAIWDKDLIGQDYMGDCILVTCALLTLQESCSQDSVMIYHDLSSCMVEGKLKGTLGVRYRITLV